MKKDYKKIVIETYPGVDLLNLKNEFLKKMTQFKIHWSEDFAMNGSKYKEAIKDDLTDDRVFGSWTKHEYRDFFIKKIKKTNKKTLVYGTGANYLIENPDLIIYIDITRWEIQRRYRNNKITFFGNSIENENTKNFKRGYFLEWRMADKIKKEIIPKSTFYVDGSGGKFNIIKTKNFFNILDEAVRNPFRLVPYFDYGVWGGNWMEKKFNLGKNKYSKWAWGFDGVPEENSILLADEKKIIEMPAINMVIFKPKKLLGKGVWMRFGEDFPIRFDFLDTMDGGNLSLQVHPDFQYIREKFFAPYTQNESYYILDTSKKNDANCYLGFKNSINKKDFIKDLYKAQKTNKMNVEKYVNKFKVKKHDHIIHPSGVIHSAGTGCMILEISSTPYIFTFKLWDWGRIGLNGLPRPINIEHGSNVLDFSFDSTKTYKELINNITKIKNEKGYIIEKTGLHETQFIECRRHSISPKIKVEINCNNSVNMLNLVSGDFIEVSTSSGYILNINFAETFIIPENCKKFFVKNRSDKKVMLIQAFIKSIG